MEIKCQLDATEVFIADLIDIFSDNKRNSIFYVILTLHRR